MKISVGDMYIVSEAPPRSHFTMIPNMIDDLPLSPHAVRLYLHLCRVIGMGGACWQSTATLAKACRMSTGIVSRVKHELANAGLIRVEEKRGAGGVYHEVMIIDIWQRNADFYAPRAENESVHNMNAQAESVHNMNAQAESVHNMNAERSQCETKNNPNKNNPNNKNNPDYDSPKANHNQARGSTSSLIPTTPGGRLLFAKLARAAKDIDPRRRGPTRFASRQQMEIFLNAERILGNDLGSAIDKALARGILRLADVIAYLAAIAKRVESERATMQIALARLDGPVGGVADSAGGDGAKMRWGRICKLAGLDERQIDILQRCDVRDDDGVLHISAPEGYALYALALFRAASRLQAAAERVGEKIILED